MATEEPDERIVHVRVCGGGAGNRPKALKQGGDSAALVQDDDALYGAPA